MNKKKRIICLTLLLSFVLSLLVPFAVSAETGTTYSNVLDDLQKDSIFNVSDYPSNPNDNSLKIVQIAESENGELFVYVYQPSYLTKEYKAKYISMSIQNPNDKNLEKDMTYKLYSLTYANSNGTLAKYVVDNFTVSKNTERYYNISAIYRAFDNTVDTKPEAVDNTLCKGYKVGEYWHAYTTLGVVLYEKSTYDIVEAVITATGSIRYSDGYYLIPGLDSACDSHYVAFYVKGYDIEELYDADITYTIVDYVSQTSLLDWDSTPEEKGRNFVECEYISSKETRSNNAGGWFGKTYTWKRIQDVETFKTEAQDDANEEFSSEELEGLNQAQYVFRFAETDYIDSVDTDSGSTYKAYSVAENIGILRLHFLSGGTTYNVGVVSDLAATDEEPELDVSTGDNIQNTLEELEKWFSQFKGDMEILFSLILVVIIVVVILSLIGPLKAIFEIIFDGIGAVSSIVLSVILWPFTIIGGLFKGGRKR